MKGTLSFTLPEEQEEFETAQKGWKYLAALDEMDEWLRSELKYKELTAATRDAYQACRDKLWEIREYRDCSKS